MRSSVRGGGRHSLGMVAVKGKCRGGRACAGPWKASQPLASKISSCTLHQAPGTIHVAVLTFTCDGVDKHAGP